MSRKRIDKGWEFSGESSTDDYNQLLAIADQPAYYQCPGESLPITAAVHQARLRTGYHLCQQCPHREDHFLFSAATKHYLQQINRPVSVRQTTYVDGIRGVVHNELSTSDIRHLVRAYCQKLISEQPNFRPAVNANLSVVIGHDSRANSLQVFDTAVKTVVEQGHSVIAIGETSGPCLQQAVRHLQTTGGIYATGSGCPVTSIGLDFFGSSGIPWSGESLHQISEQARQKSVIRSGRSTGRLESFPAAKPYLANLWKSYLHCPPLHLQLVCNNNFQKQALLELSSNSGLKLEFINVTDEELMQHNAGLFAGKKADWGVWLSEDGYACRIFHPLENELSVAEVLQILAAKEFFRPNLAPVLLIGEEWENQIEISLAFAGDQMRFRASLAEIFYRGMKTSQACLGVDAQYRYWFQEQTPVCDNLLTLARFLYAISGAEQ